MGGEESWRSWLYLGVQDAGLHAFASVVPTAPGVPSRGNYILHDDDSPASIYWVIRSKWSGLGPAEFRAFYDKWAPRRDAALAPGAAHLGKTRDEWALFYTALADEWRQRQHMHTKLDHLGGEAALQAMSDSRKAQAQLGGRSG